VAESAKTISLIGTRLSTTAPNNTLSQILHALALPQFPDHGLVVGMVLDFLGNPVANLQVMPTAGSIQYLTADRASTTMGTTSSTSSNGIFISQDAPYGTTFRALSPLASKAELGGLVDGKVTIVILQLDNQPGM
jgi:hypothetical protein